MRSRILFVDDEAELTVLMASILDLLGYDTRVATSTAAAMALLRSEHFDLVLCDVTLPGEDGLLFFHQAREMIRDCPDFIFCSGYDRLPLQLPYPPGLLTHVPKPVTMERIASLLTEHLPPRSA